ncbi:MAG: transposase [Phycisphaerae bacterium]|nr:transposase [Phycisphaerae bacterium]
MNNRTSSTPPPREGSPQRSAGVPSRAPDPDPRVEPRATRRRFTDEYRERVVREADACTEPGQVGALLRREGIYSSNLAAWRRGIRSRGAEGLAAKRRGPAPKPKPQIIKDTHLQKAISSGSPAILGDPAPNVTLKHTGAKGMIAQTRGFGLR